jgi:hypothetical protein
MHGLQQLVVDLIYRRGGSIRSYVHSECACLRSSYPKVFTARTIDRGIQLTCRYVSNRNSPCVDTPQQ